MRVTGVERVYQAGNRLYRKQPSNPQARKVNFSNEKDFINYVTDQSSEKAVNIAISMMYTNGSSGYLYTMIALANQGRIAKYIDSSPRSHEYDEGPFDPRETEAEFKRYLMGLARDKSEVTDLGGLEFSVSKR